MPPEIVYAVDIQKQAIEQLEMSIEKNRNTGIVPVNCDLKELWNEAPLGRLSLVTCNPPYKAANAGIESNQHIKLQDMRFSAILKMFAVQRQDF